MVKNVMSFFTYNGTCAEALKFYEKVFGATITERTTYGEAEMSENEEQESLIMNSTFSLGSSSFSAYDSRPVPKLTKAQIPVM